MQTPAIDEANDQERIAEARRQRVNARQRERYHSNPQEREARKAARRAYYAEHRQEISEKRRQEYWADPEKAREELIARRSKRKQHYQELNRKRFERNKQLIIKRSSANRKKNVEKSRARYAVSSAIKRGKLKRPAVCDFCHQTPEPTRNGASGLWADHYHGYDMEHRLDVLWLCKDCEAMARRLRKECVRGPRQPVPSPQSDPCLAIQP